MTAPVPIDVPRPDPDLAKAHSLFRQRAPVWERAAAAAGFPVQRLEVFRSDERQRWLYGQGRTPEQLLVIGLDPVLACPELPRVTNAPTAHTSAHGYRLADGTPAACAGDYCVLDAAGKLWAADAPWDAFMAWCLAHEQLYALRHFGPPAHPVTDRPHLQLVEYDDVTHTLTRRAA